MGKGEMYGIVWGIFLSLGNTEAVALHDCDILTYNRSLLARLVYLIGKV